MADIVGRVEFANTRAAQVNPNADASNVGKYTAQTIRQLEVDSILAFLKDHQQFLFGNVLDFGCGKEGTCRKPQPYRSLINGVYHPYDLGDDFPRPNTSTGKFDSILCTQVLQYTPNPLQQIKELVECLNDGGYLVLTYPTNWDEVEENDLWRFTKSGMERLLMSAGLDVIVHECRAEVELGGFRFPLGYGLVAYKPRPKPKPFVPTAEDSAFILTCMLQAAAPFIFVRYGDGMLECIHGVGNGRTCDGERYSPQLGMQLKEAFNMVVDSPLLYLGDWQTASFVATNQDTQYAHEYRLLIGDCNPKRLHYEALLMMSGRKTDWLRRFWRTLGLDDRRKLLVGPVGLSKAANKLRAEHLITPMVRDWTQLQPTSNTAWIEWLERELARADFDILLWGAGMASNVAVIKNWAAHQGRTYINMGSALDPAYRGQTRTQQMPSAKARELFESWLS